MLKEVDLQKLLIEACSEDNAGAGFKIDDPFIKRKVDLIIKLSDCQPVWLEAKREIYSPNTLKEGWNLDVTPHQKGFLNDWTYAGMLCGVVSFAIPKGGNVSDLKMAVYPYVKMRRDGFIAYHRDHKPMGEKSERFSNMRNMVRQFCNEVK